MPNAHFLQPGHSAGKKRQIIQVEVVASVDAQAEVTCVFRSASEGGDRLVPVCVVIMSKEASIKFDTISTNGEGTVQHSFIGVYEDGSAKASVFKPADDTFEVPGFADGVPTMVTGQLSGLVGYERYLIRFTGQYDLHEFFRRVAFDVQLRGADFFQRRYVGVTSVPLVWPWVNGDALGSEGFAVSSYLPQIRVICAPSVTNEGDFIKIY